MVEIAVESHPSSFSIDDNDIPLPDLRLDVLRRISSALTLLCMPHDLRPQCTALFRYYLLRLHQTQAARLIDRPRFESVVTSCAVIVARLHRLPISISDAAAWASTDAGQLQNTYYQITNLFTDQIYLHPSSPSIYFARVLQSARCNGAEDVLHVAHQLLAVCLKELILIGRPCSAVAAAIIAVAFRAVRRKALNPEQIARIERDLHLVSVRTDIEYVLASLTRMASLLPFHVPFGPESLDLYLPEIVSYLDQLSAIVTSDRVSCRASGPFITSEVINRIEAARAVIWCCRRLPGPIMMGELTVDILGDELELSEIEPKAHMTAAAEILIRKLVPLTAILDGQYRL